MKLGPDKFFCFMTPKNCVCHNINCFFEVNPMKFLSYVLTTLSTLDLHAEKKANSER